MDGAKAWLLRRIEARIGRGLVIKPNVRIKYPWRLTVGDHSWIGQEAWIGNLADVTLGDHVCVSQRVYLCTGSHDYRQRTFDLIVRLISIYNGGWVGAAAVVVSGVRVGANSVVAAATMVTKSVAGEAVVASVSTQLVQRRTNQAD